MAAACGSAISSRYQCESEYCARCKCFSTTACLDAQGPCEGTHVRMAIDTCITGDIHTRISWCPKQVPTTVQFCKLPRCTNTESTLDQLLGNYNMDSHTGQHESESRNMDYGHFDHFAYSYRGKPTNTLGARSLLTA